jgi:ABC-type nitrate/sulfonate/bicarbonate transport system ATPase subunit
MQSCPYNTDCAGCVSYADTLLQVRHVNLSYGDKVILRDVNAEIRDVNRKCHIQGQVVGFLGPSGIGKTQLFRIIAGLNQPTSGEVLVNCPPQPTHPGLIGVVAQSYTTFEHRTVLGNLLLGAKRRYLDHHEAEAQCLALLARFGISDKAYCYPAQLSGGQRQRVAIISQIICSSHFLLMDEPTASLDYIKRQELAELINDIACLDSLNTIIICSHEIDWLTTVADHMWLLGRDRDERGNIIPGARLQENYDLVSLGLCWQKNISERSDFIDFVKIIKERFRTL